MQLFPEMGSRYFTIWWSWHGMLFILQNNSYISGNYWIWRGFWSYKL